MFLNAVEQFVWTRQLGRQPQLLNLKINISHLANFTFSAKAYIVHYCVSLDLKRENVGHGQSVEVSVVGWFLVDLKHPAVSITSYP